MEENMEESNKTMKYSSKKCLMIAMAATELYGYTNSEYNGYGWKETPYTTKAIVRRVITHNGMDSISEAAEAYLEKYRDELSARADQMIDNIINIAENGGFLASARSSLETLLISKEQFGIIAAIPNSYESICSRAHYQERDWKRNNRYFGNVGDEVRITNIHNIEVGNVTSRGFRVIKVFDEDGYEFTAFITKGREPADFDMVKCVCGLISDHSDYKGEKSTILHSAKFFTEESIGNSGSSIEKGSEVEVEVADVLGSEYLDNHFGSFIQLKLRGGDGNYYIWNTTSKEVYEGNVVPVRLRGTIRTTFNGSDGFNYNVFGGRVRMLEGKENTAGTAC